MEFFNLIIVTVFSILEARKGLIPHFKPKSKSFQSFEIHSNSGINHFFKKKQTINKNFLEDFK